MNLKKYYLTGFLVLVLATFGFSPSGSIFEGFEDPGFTPPGWSAVNNGSTEIWERVTVAPFEGVADASVRYSPPNVLGIDWLITPRITGIIAGDSLVFYLSRVWQGTNLTWDTTHIMVSTTDTDSTSFTPIFTMGIDASDTSGQTYPPRSSAGGGTTGLYQRYALSLESFVGQNIYIAWKNLNDDGVGLRLDNVTIPGIVTAIEPTGSETPDSYALKQNYPNPFNPSTTISFSLPEQQLVTLKVYDLLGKEIATLVSGVKPAGTYDVNFSAQNLASGFYFYMLEAGSYRETKKMQLVK